MKEIRKIFFAFGTVNSITVNCEDVQETAVMTALNQIRDRLLELNDELSVFREDSAMTKIRREAGKSLVEVSESAYYIVKKSLYYAEISGKVFDITSCPLTELWRNAKNDQAVPTERELKRARKLVNYQDVILREKPYRIGLRKTGQAIDLGGIAKGYAADWTREKLEEHGIREAAINFGGTVVITGKQRKIGIQHPDSQTGKIMGSLIIENQSVVTSGVYERYFIKNGTRYHHIIDLSSGKPSVTGLCSATVIGASAMEMDALATSVILLGMEEGMKLVRQCKAECIFITDVQEVYLTPGLAEKFELKQLQEKKYGN